MNLSRRSLLCSLIAAPAVISIDNLMPVRLWLPTIYGDGVHDDWEGLDALIHDRPVNIKAKIFNYHPAAPELGMTSINNTYLLGRPLVFDGNGFRRDHFIGDLFKPAANFPAGECSIIFDEETLNFSKWEGCYIEGTKKSIF